MEVKKHIPKGKTQAAIDQKFISDICNWMYSFCTDIESKEHEKSHLQQLYLFIKLSKVTPAVNSFTENFIHNNFVPNLPKIVFYKFKNCVGGSVKVTSFVESHNASLHTSPTGPRPNHSLVTSVHRITSDGRRKRKDKANLAERNVDRRLTLKSSVDDEITELQNYAADTLSPHLTKRTVDRCMNEWKCSKNFIFMKDQNITQPFQNAGLFYLSRYLVSWNPLLERQCREVIPVWALTRTVDVVSYQGRRFLLCDCGHNHRHGSPCRHIYSLLSRKPNVGDCAPRCHKLYELQYGTNADLTTALNSYLSSHPFGLVPLNDDDDVGTSESLGLSVHLDEENLEFYKDHFTLTRESSHAWPESAFYKTDSHPTDPSLPVMDDEGGKTDFIVEERSNDPNLPSVPNMPVFVVPGAPTLMASPMKTMNATTPVFGKRVMESQKDYRKRKREEAMSSFLQVLQKAKTPTEYQFLIDKNKHTSSELDAKHAQKDAYSTIADNIGGTISGCIPITQSPNQVRKKKMNETSSTKKKLNFNRDK
mmetsp:Transcript_41263/g.98799  ORF Transcript_41263/g.98799 Transcript_41263/m.98799 type:complete len:535 (+) Transcript_41263:1909-3513(+)